MKIHYLFGAIIAIFCLQGCAVNSVSQDRYHRAILLIDQGTLSLRHGNLDQARATFTMAFQLAPIAQAIDGLACVEFLRGNLVQARELFLQAYFLDATYEQPLANLALLSEFEGDKRSALTLYEEYLRQNPEDAASRNNYAGLLYEVANDSVDRNEIELVREELLKAYSLSSNPLISHNLELVTNEIKR